MAKGSMADVDILEELEEIVPGYRTNLVQTKDGRKFIDLRTFSEKKAEEHGHGFNRIGIRMNKAQLDKAIALFIKVRDKL